jgi:uncharacterized protein YndB with AHSA1/START domain
MNELDGIEKRTLTIERKFNAPRNLVWEAWTQPEHIAKWWGPKGMKTSIKKHDFQVGGAWEYCMEMPDGKEFISHGIFSRIEAPQLLETSANFIPMTEGVTIVVEFAEVTEYTDLTFRVIHPTEEYCRQQEKRGFYNGWGSVLKGLDEHLQQTIANKS